MLEVDVMSSYKQFIRRDSPVEFKPGGTFVGAQVVALRVGSAAAPVLEAGDTLTRVSVIDPDFRSNELTAAGQDFPEIVTSLRSIGSDLSKTQSQFNSLAEHRSGLQVAIRHMSQFSLRKNGTLPLLARDHRLGERAKIAIERADSLLDFVHEPGTLGRIKADTGFRKALAGARSELDSVRIRITREDGAAGRFLADDAIEARSRGALERDRAHAGSLRQTSGALLALLAAAALRGDEDRERREGHQQQRDRQPREYSTPSHPAGARAQSASDGRAVRGRSRARAGPRATIPARAARAV